MIRQEHGLLPNNSLNKGMNSLNIIKVIDAAFDNAVSLCYDK
tara:strand:- start:27677 stop:27802 length:126 start_codon:yes stop_codon:yes gene_type:complete